MPQGFTSGFFSLGRIAQIVNYQTGTFLSGGTQMPWDNTIPQITEGDEYMTCSITPQNANNILKIEVVIYLGNGSIQRVIAALFQDATANALAVGADLTASTSWLTKIVFTHWMTAGTISSTTFRVRAGSPGAGTTRVNGEVTTGALFNGTMASSITITEYMPQAVAQQIGQLQKARAYRAAAQTLGVGTWDKIGIDTDTFDPDNITDLTNNRIIPTKAGYYQVNGEVHITNNDTLAVAIYKNGAIYSRGNKVLTTYGLAVTVSDIVYVNGSTDYIELYACATAGDPLSVATTNNYLSVVGPF